MHACIHTRTYNTYITLHAYTCICMHAYMHAYKLRGLDLEVGMTFDLLGCYI